jgi:hypothetical protein
MYYYQNKESHDEEKMKTEVLNLAAARPEKNITSRQNHHRPTTSLFPTPISAGS